MCILCEEWGDISLHKASTLGLDDKVRRCAMICQDKSLIAKLSAGDLIAINAEYHLSCLTKLHHKPQSELNKAERNDSISVQTAKVQAFSDLVEYIECQRGSDIPVLHMSLGLCLSATRLKTISTDLANSVVAHYESCGFFVPPAALHAVFTILQADNFDHNPSSTTCGTSFHGHSISFLQYPTDEPCAASGPLPVMNPAVMGRRNVSTLPESYTSMEEVILRKDDECFVPKLNCNAPPLPACPRLKNNITGGINMVTTIS